MKSLPVIHPEKEIKKVTAFLRQTLEAQHISHVVLGLSGGIDSATAFFLLQKALPKESVHLLHMPYFQEDKDAKMLFSQSDIPKKNKNIISIKSSVDAIAQNLNIKKEDTIRLANVMARTRMITLFDYAKKYNALVVGTENKSEHYLGYFTRFGDQASDIEPVQHLYKTQMYELAKTLNVPKSIQNKQPSAGLWSGQTDESEFGFTYQEADQVLYLYFEKKKSIDSITNAGFANAKKIISHVNKNSFKHRVPYLLKK